MKNTVEVPDSLTLNDSAILLLVYIQRKLSKVSMLMRHLSPPPAYRSTVHNSKDMEITFYQLTNEQKRTRFTYTGNII